ncbi:MAG: substrate-binding domain-containing protein [Phycisphaerae bacterium]
MAWSLAALMFPAIGCRQKPDSATGQPAGFMGVVGVGQDDPLWPVLRQTALRVYDEPGPTTMPMRATAPGARSVNAQRHLIERLHKDGMVALCVQVTDAEALRGTLEKLSGQGVRIVTMMRRVKSSRPYVHSGPDEGAIGRAMAQALRDALDGRGTVAVLHADSVSDESVARHRALIEALGSFGSVRIILDYDCRADPILARRLIRDTMRRYPRLGGWAVTGNWPLRAGDDGEPLVPATCRIVAVDPFPATWRCFEQDRVFAMIASDYERIAAHAVTTCRSLAMGTASMPTSFASPARAVRAETLEAFKQDWQRWTSRSADRSK